jgi:phosphoribosylformylglycinamidine synthase
MAFGGDVGFKVDITAEGCTAAEACFAESASRVICAVEKDKLAAVLGRAAAAGVPAVVLGEATGRRLIATGAFDIALTDAHAAWRDAIPTLMGRR